MSEGQLAHLRGMLAAWRNDLMEEVDRTVNHMQDEAANFPDPADRATQEEEFSIELRTRDRERKLIKKIDGTIERLDQDDYGYCDPSIVGFIVIWSAFGYMFYAAIVGIIERIMG